MALQPNIEIEKILNEWTIRRDTLRKIFVGKEKFASFMLNEKLNSYPSSGICDYKFNFALEGNKCSGCNELSLLTKTGDFTIEDINITLDDHDDVKLRASKFPHISCEISYEKDKLSFAYNNLPQLSIFKPKDLVNVKILLYKDPNDNICLKAREIVTACIQEWLSSPSITFVGAYSCDSLVLINKIVSPRIPLNLKFNNMCSVIYQLISGSEKNFVHGKESLEYLYIKGGIEKIVKTKGESIKHKCSVLIKTCESTSINVNGYNYDVFVPSSTFDKTYEGSFPIDVKVFKTNKKSKVSFNFPMMNEYKEIAHFVIPISEELFTYREKISVNVFKPLTVYIWLIAFLCNEQMYNCLMTNEELLDIFFFPEDLLKIKHEVITRHSTPIIYYSEIKALCLSLRFTMKLDVFEEAKTYLIEQLKA